MIRTTDQTKHQTNSPDVDEIDEGKRPFRLVNYKYQTDSKLGNKLLVQCMKTHLARTVVEVVVSVRDGKEPILG